MADFFVPKIIDGLVHVAFEQIGTRVNLVMGVEEEVRNLSDKLRTLEKVLHDAEKRKLKEEGVWVWLERIQDVAYEIEDVLDDWKCKILKPETHHQPQAPQRTRRTLLDKISSFVPSLCSCLKQVQQVPVRSDIALKIKDINDELELILKEANQFNFVTTFSGLHKVNSSHDHEFKRPMTTSVFDVSEARGRDSDKKSLLEHLLRGKENGVKVISIVGVGGSGKTTLAQVLYNDDTVNKHFQLRKWVCVSDPFDENRIARALAESPENSNINNVSELDSLLELVKEKYYGKRFLLVLDDVWTEKNSEWKPFRDSLKDGAPGSIVLVTTRKGSVARVVDTDYMHNITLLSDSDCWLIIKQIALSKRIELCNRVERVGLKIAKKCKGLPLAAKALGSLLQHKDTVQEWQQVLDSEIWKMEETSVDVFPHFYFSYNELSSQLKQCFLYCAVFPKDTVIDVSRLVLLWMAQGYLSRSSQRGDDNMMERKGYEYFKILAGRSFFQELQQDIVYINRICSCKMHDIVHDFAQFLIKNECCNFEEVNGQNVNKNGEYLTKERVRHLRIDDRIPSINSSIVSDIGKLRSLFLLYTVDLSQDLCRSLKSLRSLTLSGCRLEELPQEIGKLIHMRLLDVSANQFIKLPETICDLYFLETLDLSDSLSLQHLPQRIGDLVHLRHLLIDGTSSLRQMSGGIEKLTSLRSLTKFIVNGDVGSSSNIAMLKNLNQLEDLRMIVRGPQDFENAQLGNKVHLYLLSLEFEMSRFDAQKESCWMNKTDPPPYLQVLLLYKYPTNQLPIWIVCKPFINNLTTLSLEGAPWISTLPALGKLSSLQKLVLFNLPMLKHLGGEFYGLVDDDDDLEEGHSSREDGVEIVAFPSLKRLYLGSLESWETWEDISERPYMENTSNTGGTISFSVMPLLEYLEIVFCSNLEALPHQIIGKASFLKEINLWYNRKLSNLYSKETERHKLSHVPKLNITIRRRD